MDDLPSAQGPPLFQSIGTPEKEQVQLRKKLRIGSPGPAVPPPDFAPPPPPPRIRMQGEMPPPDRPSSRGQLDPIMQRLKDAKKRALEERDRRRFEDPAPQPKITTLFKPKGGKRKTRRKIKRKNKKSRKHKK
jgi:hypothetical protein